MELGVISPFSSDFESVLRLSTASVPPASAFSKIRRRPPRREWASMLLFLAPRYTAVPPFHRQVNSKWQKGLSRSPFPPLSPFPVSLPLWNSRWLSFFSFCTILFKISPARAFFFFLSPPSPGFFQERIRQFWDMDTFFRGSPKSHSYFSLTVYDAPSLPPDLLWYPTFAL